MISKLSLWLIAGVVVIALFLSLIKKKKPYNSFTRGCKDGLSLFVEVFPSVMAMLLAISVLEASGLIDDIAFFLSAFLKKASIIADITPMLFFRPISGSASLAVLNNVCSVNADSQSCKIASTIQGSTDTTLYVLSLYFSTVQITKWKHALKVGLIADVAGMGMGIILSLIFLH